MIEFDALRASPCLRLAVGTSERTSRYLQETIEGLVREFTGGCCVAPLTERDVEWDGECQRLWQCVAWHWEFVLEQNRNASFEAVLESLRQGLSPANGNPIGGNPCRDLILAGGVCRMDERALSRFEREYFPLIDETAKKHDSRELIDWVFQDPDPKHGDWLGYLTKTNRLRTYVGRSGLDPWLRNLVRSRVKEVERNWSRTRSGQASTLTTDLLEDAPESDPAELVANSDLLDRTRALIAEELKTMSPRDREVVVLWLNGLSIKAIATRDGRAPGNVTRLVQRFKASLIPEVTNGGRL